MKTVSVVVFLAIFGLAFANTEETKDVKTLSDEAWQHSITDGDCSNISKLDNLLTKPVSADGHLFQYQTDEADYSGNQIIKCIIVTNSGDGYTAIAAGGVGQHYVQLKFKSKWSGGLDFQADVYGL